MLPLLAARVPGLWPLAAARVSLPMRVEVFDNQVEPALKALKKAMLNAGIFKEMKRRSYYEKPSVKRKRKQAEARRKRRKAARRSESATT